MSRTIYAVAIGLSLAGQGLAAHDARVTLILKSHVLVERDTVLLSDVADIQSADAALNRSLAELSLGDAPVSRTHVYARAMLAKLVKRGLADAPAIEWRGAERVSLERRTVVYAGDALVDAARKQLSVVLRDLDPALTRLDIQGAERQESIVLPAGDISINAQPLRVRGLSKRMCVWLDVSVNGQVRRHLPVWLTVSAYKPVKVAVRAVAAREAVASSDFRTEEKDVAGLLHEPLGMQDDIAAWRMRRSLSAGAVVLSADVETPPAVLRDQEVQVQVGSGSISLETKAVAEQEGRIGDQIRLRNPSSNASFQARIVGVGQAFVSTR